MKILMLQDDLFTYLQHVVKAYAGSGIDPEEGLGVYHLSQALKNAQVVDENEVAKIQAGDTASGVPVAAVSISRDSGT